ncbi:unnamed protein product [Bursaphelenchus xylophilus]|uniref:(pine wood nematode) hypothetical protein n=1 Tax=Bursaphelenchus xylophilus TaxID=6326 RepID=A0A1I7SBW1_BURXY|nr:unnamed protein product [Bursaphelenchus xylophilus]CAG9112976.1 unnamed protein product [Bursaphelenchus xylophilus]
MLNSVLLSLILVANQQQFINAASPPSFIAEPPATVWFQPNDDLTGRQTKIELPCTADGDPETFKWKKDEQDFAIDGEHVIWTRPEQSGSIQFKNPTFEDEGFYQCFVSNAFGTAVSNRVHVRRGFLQHFSERPLRILRIKEGKSVSIPCEAPSGTPKPTVNWVLRDLQVHSVLESVGKNNRISVDEEGTLHFTYVERNDSQSTRIFECAVSSPVLRGEYRGGDRVQLVVLPQKNIPILEPHLLYRSPERVQVRAGETLKLTCIHGGYPFPRPVWSRKNAPLPMNRHRADLSDEGRRLILEDVHPEDAGVYVCEMYGDEQLFNVIVEAAPFWEHGKPVDVTVDEGETADLRCNALGSPRPLLRWLMNGVPLHELKDNSTRRTILEDGKLLRIHNVRPDMDTGVYQCNASNPLGFVFANAYINVLSLPPKFLSPEKKIWRVALGQTVDFPCDVIAAPKAKVHWVDVNDQAIPTVEGKLEILENHTLRIYNVHREDEGVYYCNVSNKYGINRAENTLMVYDPMYFVEVPKPARLEVDAFADVELRCQAKADKRLNIEYIWSREGEKITEAPVMEEDVSVLRLDNVRGRDTGHIKCTVATEIGKKSSGVYLIVRDVPEPPSEISMTCQANSALISWQRPKAHGSPITDYRIELRTNFDPDNWKTALLVPNTNRSEYEAHVQLSPWIIYDFRIVAINMYGESSPGSSVTAHCETRPNIPFSNPKNVKVFGTEPDNLVISWDPMPKPDWNAPGLKYQIRYRRQKKGAAWKEFFVEDPLANHTILRDIPTFKPFEVQVRAVNERGPSSVEPQIVAGFSGEDIPLTPPANVLVQEIPEYNRAIIAWDPVDPTTLRGFFRGYKIIYWDQKTPNIVNEVKVGPERLKAEIGGLNAMTNYTVEVRAINERHESSSSLPANFLTPEGRPSEVTRLKVTAVGAQSMLATWDLPRELNGHIRGYYVAFQNASAKDEVSESYVIYSQRYYLAEQLTPDTEYLFYVWAETNGGEGPNVSKAFRTFPLRHPDPPKFSAIPTSSTSFKITWHPNNGSNWGLSGTTFHLKYGILGSSDFNRTDEIALPTRSFLLDNLLPDADYWILGVARENDRHTESQEYQLHTSSGINLSHLNTENLREAAWFIVILIVLAVALVILVLCCCCAHFRGRKYSVKKRERQFGKPDRDSDEYRKFLEYHHLNERDDPPTISVSLAADSTLDSRKRAPSIEDSQKSHGSLNEHAQLLPNKN